MKSNLFPVQTILHVSQPYHPAQPLLDPYAETCSKVITGSFGTILYKQINGYYNTYRHYHCFIRQPADVPCLEMEDRPFICVNLKNTIFLKPVGNMELPFYEWGSNMIYQPAEPGQVLFKKEGDYSFVTIHIEPSWMEQYVQSYNAGESFLKAAIEKRPALLCAANFPANIPMRTAISDILYYDYADRYFLVYLAVKFQEFLLPFLQQSLQVVPLTIPVSENEAEALYRVKERLLAQLHLPHVLEDLAQFAHLSEYKLKYGFRQVYGMGPLDFLHEIRMKKAYELVADTLLPYDVIAATIGYQSVTTFFNQFKKYAGISPKRLRDSIQGRGARCCNRRK